MSRPNVKRYGLTLHGEAVVRGEHTVYFIVDATDEAAVRHFMEPFAGAGTVDVYAAATCAGVVSGGGCSAPAPDVSGGSVAALDPEDACQQAIDGGLVVHRAHPLNGETSLPALIGGVVMPNARFYIRNHFQIPNLTEADWRLEVKGRVDRPLRLSLRELKQMPSQTKVVTLECAGNGRALLEPRVDGEQWSLGAVSTAEWTGVPLTELLDRAGIKPDGRYLVFRGADGGKVAPDRAPIRFERSLAVDGIRNEEALLAYAMNGDALPTHHGFPARLIVPGWYAVASVKWLTEIEVVTEPLEAFYQTERYFFEETNDGVVTREPVSLMRVRSLVTDPVVGSQVEPGDIAVRGVAWSGAAPIAKVEVQVDGGRWQETKLLGERRRAAWQWWEVVVRLDEPGRHVLRPRATDMAGRTQPLSAPWNRLGYGNNMMQVVGLHVQLSD
jgi:DMSO/TMAO reductase YedYZ molybdopterin-dependent catalytic subunit